jgi:hypothetical protein
LKEISVLALKFMQDFAISPVPHAVFLVEDETKDEAQLYKSYYEANRAWDNLLDLELVEDGRPIQGQWLDALEEKTGRKFRMFVLTDYGRMFTDPRASAWPN